MYTTESGNEIKDLSLTYNTRRLCCMTPNQKENLRCRSDQEVIVWSHSIHQPAFFLYASPLLRQKAHLQLIVTKLNAQVYQLVDDVSVFLQKAYLFIVGLMSSLCLQRVHFLHSVSLFLEKTDLAS